MVTLEELQQFHGNLMRFVEDEKTASNEYLLLAQKAHALGLHREANSLEDISATESTHYNTLLEILDVVNGTIHTMSRMPQYSREETPPLGKDDATSILNPIDEMSSEAWMKSLTYDQMKHRIVYLAEELHNLIYPSLKQQLKDIDEITLQKWSTVTVSETARWVYMDVHNVRFEINKDNCDVFVKGQKIGSLTTITAQQLFKAV